MFKDLVIRNRSCRGYDESRKISREELLDLIDTARLTGSAVNQQALKFAIYYQPDDVEKVLSLTRWAAGLPELHLPRDGQHPTAFVVICHDTDISKNTEGFAKMDVGIAAQTILLAAVEKDLGGLMIGAFNPDRVKAELALPENLIPQLIVALGKPAETVQIVEIENGESTKYYRDENDVHYVPKRKLADIVVE